MENLQDFAALTLSIRSSKTVKKKAGKYSNPDKIYFTKNTVILGDNVVKLLSNEQGEMVNGIDFSISANNKVAAIIVPLDVKKGGKPVIMVQKSGSDKMLNLRKYLSTVYSIPENQLFTVELVGEPVLVEKIIANREGYITGDVVRSNVNLYAINVEFTTQEVEEVEEENETESVEESVINEVDTVIQSKPVETVTTVEAEVDDNEWGI